MTVTFATRVVFDIPTTVEVNVNVEFDVVRFPVESDEFDMLVLNLGDVDNERFVTVVVVRLNIPGVPIVVFAIGLVFVRFVEISEELVNETETFRFACVSIVVFDRRTGFVVVVFGVNELLVVEVFD